MPTCSINSSVSSNRVLVVTKGEHLSHELLRECSANSNQNTISKASPCTHTPALPLLRIQSENANAKQLKCWCNLSVQTHQIMSKFNIHQHPACAFIPTHITPTGINSHWCFTRGPGRHGIALIVMIVPCYLDMLGQRWCKRTLNAWNNIKPTSPCYANDSMFDFNVVTVQLLELLESHILTETQLKSFHNKLVCFRRVEMNKIDRLQASNESP